MNLTVEEAGTAHSVDLTSLPRNIAIALGNTVEGDGAVVGGGTANLTQGNYSTVGGGHNNEATAGEATVAGGDSNVASGVDSAIGGGQNNQSAGVFAYLGGGRRNYVGTCSEATQMPTDCDNEITGEPFATCPRCLADSDPAAMVNSSSVVGGRDNAVTNNYSAVVGGVDQLAAGETSFIGGGVLNTTTAMRTAIVGGENNRVDAAYSSIGGGRSNGVSGVYSCVAGGQANQASGDRAAIGGGRGNIAIGSASTIPGGRFNVAGGDSSFAAGRRAQTCEPETLADGSTACVAGTAREGAFVWADAADQDFRASADNCFDVRARGGVRFVTAIDGVGQPTAGVELPAGAGAWSTLSDRESKTDFQVVDGWEVLEKLMRLPIDSWRWKTQEGVRHIGPIAQDFHAAFGLGDSDRRISTVDADGVALAAIQGLSEVIEQQDARIAQQQEQIEALSARLEALEARLGNE